MLDGAHTSINSLVNTPMLNIHGNMNFIASLIESNLLSSACVTHLGWCGCQPEAAERLLVPGGSLSSPSLSESSLALEAPPAPARCLHRLPLASGGLAMRKGASGEGCGPWHTLHAPPCTKYRGDTTKHGHEEGCQWGGLRALARLACSSLHEEKGGHNQAWP